jgi:hypothetical protein
LADPDRPRSSHCIRAIGAVFNLVLDLVLDIGAHQAAISAKSRRPYSCLCYLQGVGMPALCESSTRVMTNLQIATFEDRIHVLQFGNLKLQYIDFAI